MSGTNVHTFQIAMLIEPFTYMGEFTLTQSVAFIPGLSHFREHITSGVYVTNTEVKLVHYEQH